MPCLMVEEVHAREGAGEASGQGDKEEGPFGDAPAAMDGFPFVQAVEEKGENVDQEEG